MMSSENSVFFAPDLTKRAPRSVRVRLGGFVILPRILDKCRALIAGTNGEFNYDCPIDQHFLRFVKVDAEALKAEVATGKGDGEILNWIMENAGNFPKPWEISQWSAYHEQRVADGDTETWTFFGDYVKKFTTTREDVQTWFDLLDIDDYATFGGKP